MPVSALPNLLGTTLAGKYELVKLIGEGGMGVVYEAVNGLTGRHVAVKLLLAGADDDQARQRLLREARAAAGLSHPNVVDVLDVAVDADCGAFLVMELLSGESLHDYISRRGRLSFAETAAVLEPVAAALECAHRAGVVHRDLKPSNIFLHTDARGKTTPKLVDFGIALADGPRLTQTGAMTGTAGYMAPEQMTDAKRATPRSDVWAFGVVVYECLSGSLPFEGTTLVELIANVMARRLIPLDQIVPSTPPHVVSAVHRALTTEPEQRPPGIQAFSDALGFNSSPVSVTNSEAPKTEAFVRSSPLPFAPTVPARAAPTEMQTAPPIQAAVRKAALKRSVVGLGAALALGALGWFALSQRAASTEHAAAAGAAEAPLRFSHEAALPALEFRTIDGGSATLGSTREEAQAAREACASESGLERCPAPRFERAAPVLTALVPSFRLARHETTNGELFAWLTNQSGFVVEAGKAWLRDSDGRALSLGTEASSQAGLSLQGDQLVVRAGFADRPAVGVLRRVAVRFCGALGARLPTRAEWEWAARGAKRRRYPWGNALFVCHRAVSARSAGLACATSAAELSSVLSWGQDETPEGVTGLSGNAAEWVHDAAPRNWTNAEAPCDAAGCFVIKGGDWASPSWLTLSADGRMAPADFTAGWLGFRCAADGN